MKISHTLSMLATVTFLTAACTSTLLPAAADNPKKRLESKVLDRAAFDFDCDRAALRVESVQGQTIRIVGCGNRATYVTKNTWCSDYRSDSAFEEKCELILDVASEESAAP